MFYDVVVVGGGIAGLMAAIEAKSPTNNVALITKGNIFKSNSSRASGGINAVLDKNDKEALAAHILDTINSAKGLANKKAIRFMCKEGSHIIKKLIEYGVKFQRDEEGNILQRPFGGCSLKRTCYIGDKTGSHITQSLIKKAKELNITFLVNNFVLDITKDKNTISSIICLKRTDSSLEVYRTKALILAGGGYAGIFKANSTNTQDYTGDLLALCLKNGLNLRDMEFIQFHPTGIAKTTSLVSEAARAEGGYLVNSKGQRFVDELETRDKVARAILEQEKNNQEVFIDLRHLPLKVIQEKLPSLYASAFNQCGIDISKELLKVKPLAHYSMGGVDCNMCACEIKGLFICGEMAANGIHGANRLGGNSLLEASVFGILAGKEARKFSLRNEILEVDFSLVNKHKKIIKTIFEGESSKNFNAIRTSMGNCLYNNLGIIRTKQSLVQAFDYIRYLRKEGYSLHCINKEKNNNVELIAILELRNALEISEAIILSARKRKESRGAHFRQDYPQCKKEFSKSILVKEFKVGYFKLSFKENKIKKFLKELFINNK